MTTDLSAKESAVVATLLAECPDDLPPVCARLLRHAPESFDDLRYGHLAVAIRRLRDSGRPVAPLTVREQLNNLDDAGGALFLDSLPAQAVSLDIAEYEAADVWESYRHRMIKSVCRDALAAMEACPTKSDIILASFRQSLEALDEAMPETNDAHPWIDAGLAASNADILLGPGRWVTRGAGVLVVAYTGAGKSTWTATQGFSWALGRESLGMRPTAPLRSLVFQAEDDAGDLGAMASSIIGELAPTEAEREQIRRNVLIITETAATGIEFLKQRVAPALRKYAPDLLWINPISTYFGGDLNKQQEVAAFFRNTLNPLLLQYRCACFAIHHCPKPSKERNDWAGGQLAYAGAGSADMANWAREVITLKEISPGLFEMGLAKRWRKIGWSDDENQPTRIRLIAHDRHGGQVWRGATPDILDELGAKRYSDAALLALVPDAGIDRAELVRRVADLFAVSERSAGKYVSDARRERRRNVNGSAQHIAILGETTRPRRDVYPDKPEGRAVVWLTKRATDKESVKEALRKP